MAEQPTIAITIGRQLGAGGAVLGQRLAHRLGFDYLDQEVLRLAAERLGLDLKDLSPWDERLSRFRDRIFEVFAFGPPDGIYTPPPRTAAVRDQELFAVETRVIQEVAAQRCVVVIGRGGLAPWTMWFPREGS